MPNMDILRNDIQYYFGGKYSPTSCICICRSSSCGKLTGVGEIKRLDISLNAQEQTHNSCISKLEVAVINQQDIHFDFMQVLGETPILEIAYAAELRRP